MTKISHDRGTEPPDGMTSCTPCGISEEILLPTELIRQETEEPQPDTVEGILTQIGVLLKEAVQSTLNNRKRLIVAGVLALVWFCISLLPALGINPIPVQVLSFLTFAKGGLTGGIPGFFGGILGKGLIAYLVASLVLGRFDLSKLGQNLTSFFSSFTGKFGLDTLSPMIAGAGVALILYNFMAGTATVQNCLVGIAAFLLAVTAFAGKGGFLRRIVTTLLFQKKKFDTSVITRFLAGWALGFALGTVVSLLPFFAYLCYILGAVLLAGGIILFVITSQNTKGAGV